MVFRDPSSIKNSDDQVLVLTPRPEAKSSTGMVDKRLFTGQNTLHAQMDPETRLWTMRYEFGGVPQPLKQRFTSFTKLYKFAEEYFDKRNIDIKEVHNA